MLLDKKGRRINSAAEKTNTFDNEDPIVRRLLNILATPYQQHFDWMCAPIFRDVIVFYGDNDEIVLPLNVCFSCHGMLIENDESIIADNKTYELLRKWFIDLGHKDIQFGY